MQHYNGCQVLTQLRVSASSCGCKFLRLTVAIMNLIIAEEGAVLKTLRQDILRGYQGLMFSLFQKRSCNDYALLFSDATYSFTDWIFAHSQREQTNTCGGIKNRWLLPWVHEWQKHFLTLWFYCHWKMGNSTNSATNLSLHANSKK